MLHQVRPSDVSQPTTQFNRHRDKTTQLQLQQSVRRHCAPVLQVAGPRSNVKYARSRAGVRNFVTAAEEDVDEVLQLTPVRQSRSRNGGTGTSPAGPADEQEQVHGRQQSHHHDHEFLYSLLPADAATRVLRRLEGEALRLRHKALRPAIRAARLSQLRWLQGLLEAEQGQQTAQLQAWRRRLERGGVDALWMGALSNVPSAKLTALQPILAEIRRELGNDQRADRPASRKASISSDKLLSIFTRTTAGYERLEVQRLSIRASMIQQYMKQWPGAAPEAKKCFEMATGTNLEAFSMVGVSHW